MQSVNFRNLTSKSMVGLGAVLLIGIGWLDYLTGPYLSFGIFYLPPIALIAWFGGRWLGILGPIEGALLWFTADYFTQAALPLELHIWRAFVMFVMFVITFLYVMTTRRQLVTLERDLTETKREVETLRTLLPICSHCKKIRDERGTWRQIEIYVRERTNMEFSHGICPECSEKYYGRPLGQKA